MNCCNDNGDCTQGRDCPVRTRRVRAGQPAPPIFLDPVDLDEEQDELPTWMAALIVLMIMTIVGMFVFGLVSVL
jgi:hypothetical protein